jgi:hypothetical protein
MAFCQLCVYLECVQKDFLQEGCHEVKVCVDFALYL